MRSLIVTALAALALALVSAPTAGAVAHWYTNAPNSSFVANQVRPYTWTVQIVGGSSLTIRCSSVRHDGLTPVASGTTTSFAFNFHPSSCSIFDYGRDNAVDPPWCGNAWTVGFNANYLAGTATGGWTTCTNFTFHLVWFNCDITYGYVSTLGGVLVDDRNAADTAYASYTTAGGSRVSWNNVSLPYTTNCPNWEYPPSGTGQFNGEAFFPRIWTGP